MKMRKEEFINLLVLKAKENGINITNQQAEQMHRYKELLLEWNDKINLTAITDDEDIIVKHFVDSLLCVEYIQNNGSLIDVGTGAGFPGIVLAIYFEGKIKITLLDSLNKRINFLNEVIVDLGLKNIEAIHGRAEEVAHKKEFREAYDIAIARAVAPLNILLEYLSGYVKTKGICICMKSISAVDELQKAKKAIDILNLNMRENITKMVNYKGEDITRQIIIFNKKECLNNKYPRSYGKIKKTPL